VRVMTVGRTGGADVLCYKRANAPLRAAAGVRTAVGGRKLLDGVRPFSHVTLWTLSHPPRIAAVRRSDRAMSNVINVPTTAEAPAPRRLDAPPTVAAGKVDWPYAVSFAVYHLAALLALAPYCFSWTGVIVCWAGTYVFGTLGINLCFHRLLTHRSFECPKWLERILAVLGVCCLQDTPARWVAVHRLHHQHSDE